jgi:nucleolar protein 14
MQRRETLLLEVQTRNKVGGILDRRIGEDDPNMTAEERAIKRFTKERSRKKGASLFDLEGGDGEDLLTHGGRTIDLNDEDYDAASLRSESDIENGNVRKRKIPEGGDDGYQVGESNVDGDEPSRKKSKQEVMEEVIKKSKLFKYERQKAKEDDDEIRLELDQDFSSVQTALGAFKEAIERGAKSKVGNGQANGDPDMHPDRMALLNGTSSKVTDGLYDEQIRKIARDQRAQPSDRIKTEEEKAEEAVALAKELEEKRTRRMLGDLVEDSDNGPESLDENDNADEYENDAAEFGLMNVMHSRPEGIDDEDDFLIEEGLLASGSEDEMDEEAVFSSENESEDDLLAPGDNDYDLSTVQSLTKSSSCPRNIEEVKSVLQGVSYDQYHETIRRIRIQNDPAADAENKSKLANFSNSLVGYLVEMPSLSPKPPSSVIDVVIRHIHSMARKSPDPVSVAFRAHLQKMHETKSMAAGDLIVLTAIGSIFPPSDHFHQVVTPAILLMARWLGMTKPQTTLDLSIGAYLVALCLKYQSLAKRYIPEMAHFTILALQSGKSQNILNPHIKNLIAMADLWSTKHAFIEIFSPAALSALQSIKAQKAIKHLQLLLSQAQLSRRMLELHHHRPLAIKTFVPKFEEGFDPRKHYDPDPERAESIRLLKDYKRERKGAMRELRKDANFLSREKLREKKERDRVYAEKFRKLEAEIQGEEGKEKNAYERVKRLRKAKR